MYSYLLKKTDKWQVAVNAVVSLRILLIAGTTKLSADLLPSEEGLCSMGLVHFLVMRFTCIKPNLPEMEKKFVSMRFHCKHTSLCVTLVCRFGGVVIVFVSSLVCFILSSIFKCILCILFSCFYEIAIDFLIFVLRKY